MKGHRLHPNIHLVINENSSQNSYANLFHGNWEQNPSADLPYFEPPADCKVFPFKGQPAEKEKPIVIDYEQLYREIKALRKQVSNIETNTLRNKMEILGIQEIVRGLKPGRNRTTEKGKNKNIENLKNKMKTLFEKQGNLDYLDIMKELRTNDVEAVIQICDVLEQEGFIREVR